MDSAPDALAEKVAAADLGVVVLDRSSSPDPAMGAPVPVDESQLWIDAARQYGDVARQMVPERARAHWTDERLANVGAALARCAKHYGWKFGGLVTHPLAGLACATFPLAWPILEPAVMPMIEEAMRGKQPPAASPAPAVPAEAPAPSPDVAIGSREPELV